MQVNENQLNAILCTTFQYVIPKFQRGYCWNESHWQTLWDDILETLDSTEEHFFGSIVLQKDTKNSEVDKVLIIDGQQRLTTISIILIAIRDYLEKSFSQDKADDINEQYLVRKRRENYDDFFRILLTDLKGVGTNVSDKDLYKNLINHEETDKRSPIYNAYNFFYKRIENLREESNSKINDISKFQTTILKKLKVVEIVLNEDDNPYKVFESLNHKGEELTEADLIRNYLFMELKDFDETEKNKLYEQKWEAAEKSFKINDKNDGKTFSEFLRHLQIVESQKDIHKDKVFSELKKKCKGEKDVIDYLEKVLKFSKIYSKFINPKIQVTLSINSPEIEAKLIDLKKLNFTACYPFLLCCFDDLLKEKIKKVELLEIMNIIENYRIRTKNAKIRPSLYKTVTSDPRSKITDSLKKYLKSDDYMENRDFKRYLTNTDMYNKTKYKTVYILEKVEQFLVKQNGIKSDLNLGNLTIEHIMPQTLSQEWEHELGQHHQSQHEKWKDNLGNLTLTANNTKLSNHGIDRKKEIYDKSQLEINKKLQEYTNWTQKEIAERANSLAEICTKIWPNFDVK